MKVAQAVSGWVDIAPASAINVTTSQQATNHIPSTQLPSIVPLPAYSRTRCINQEEWEKQRPIISRLYTDQGLKLVEVQKQLAEQHGFEATLQMYKRQFREWKLWKNYRHDQKKGALILLSEQEPMADQAVKLNVILVSSKPVKRAKLARKVMRRGNRTSLTPPPNLDRITLRASKDQETVEALLHSVKEYYAWYFLQAVLEKDYGFGPDMDHVFSHIASARRVIDNDAPMAFAMMNTACLHVDNVIRHAPFQLIQHIMSELGTWQWSGKSLPARAALVGFMTMMATQILRSFHPLCKVLKLLQAEMRGDAVPVVVTMLADIVSEHMLDDEERKMDVQNYLGDSLFHAGDMEGAATIYMEIIQRSETVGRTHASVRRAMKNLGWIRFKQENMDQAMKIFLNACNLNCEATGAPNADFAGTSTCRYIATLYDKLGDDNTVEHHYKLAFEGYLRYAGIDSSGVLRYLDYLEDVLTRHGKIAEIAELRSKYGEVWEKWERKKLTEAAFVDSEYAETRPFS